MDIKRYSISQDYEFELLPDGLSFFQRRGVLRNKINERSENTLFFIQKNKFLTVEVEDGAVGWLQYEKALFFYSLFNISTKYLLISENDNYFYGYIDGFPCVFKDNYEETLNILSEYSDGDGNSITQYAIGQSSINYLQKKSLEEVCSILQVPVNSEFTYVMEDSEEYSDNVCGNKEFSNLCFLWKEKLYSVAKRQQKRGCVFFLVGIFFLVLNYLFNS